MGSYAALIVHLLATTGDCACVPAFSLSLHFRPSPLAIRPLSLSTLHYPFPLDQTRKGSDNTRTEEAAQMVSPRLQHRVQLILLVALFAGYFAVNLAITTLAVRSYMQGKYDTAIYQNSLWQAGQFQNPVVEITYAISGIRTHQFTGLHVIPIGFVYGPLYRFLPGMPTTAFLYAVFFTLAGGFVYLAARRISGSFVVAFALTSIYLWVFTPLGGNFYALEDWSACYMAAGLYFVARRQFRAASLFFLLGAMGKNISAWRLARSALRSALAHYCTYSICAARAPRWHGQGCQRSWSACARSAPRHSGVCSGLSSAHFTLPSASLSSCPPWNRTGATSTCSRRSVVPPPACWIPCALTRSSSCNA